MPRASWPTLFLAVAACVDARPVSLVAGRSDTVIVNSRGSVSLPVRLVDVNGVERRARGVRYRLIPGGDIELADGGRVTCDRPGDAEVEAMYGDLSTRLTVLCRPIEGFRIGRVLRLTIGGPPAPLDVEAYGVNRHRCRPGRGDRIGPGQSGRNCLLTATCMPGPAVSPRWTWRRGTARCRPRSRWSSRAARRRGCSRTSSTPSRSACRQVSCATGACLPGRYEISLFLDGGPPAHLRLASHQMNCAALPRTEQQYSCIASDQASVIVHHTEPAGRGR